LNGAFVIEKIGTRNIKNIGDKIYEVEDLMIIGTGPLPYQKGLITIPVSV
jgi:hypothetical protein